MIGKTFPRPNPTTVALTLAMIGAPLAAGAAPIELVAKGGLPAITSDGLVLTPAVLESGHPHDRAGGFGSGLAYTGVRDLYLAVPDRGPGDGNTSYLDRYYVLDIAVPPPVAGAVGAVAVNIASAKLLENELGTAFTGNSMAFDATGSPASGRLDPEAIRVMGVGHFVVSDEYGPYVYEFSATGKRTRWFAVPPKFLIPNPLANPLPPLVGPTELPPTNSTGRQANRGMEGLAISPDGTKLYGIMQNSLIQDGALTAPPGNKRIGLSNRILEIDVSSGATRELVYQLSNKGNGVNEMVAINDHELLVIERDGNGGTAAVTKSIFKIDISGATDVSGYPALPTTGLPAGVTAVTKTPFIDLLDPAFGLVGATFPEKVEGLAFGPDLPDGRHLLLVSTDNDFVETQDTRFFAFAIDPATSFTPQTLAIDIDVRPGDPDNHIAARSRGAVPIAIFGNDLLPVDAIDRASIRLAGAPPMKVLGQRLCVAIDGNDDGRDDLYCLIDAEKMSLPVDATTVELAARTTTGSPIGASDQVTLVGRR